MRRRLTLATAVMLGTVGCKTAAVKEEAPPQPMEAQSVAQPEAAQGGAADAGTSAPAGAPLVAIPPAPALPVAPAHLPPVEEPADNPTTPEKAYLGSMLFFDKRLSKDDSMACEGCHHIDKAYTSGN